MPARMIVLSGGESSAALDLAAEPRYLVITPSAEKNAISLAGEDAGVDDRLVELFNRGEFVHLRNLRPWQTVNVNGEKNIDQGERAVLRDGEVVTIRDVVLRVSAQPQVATPLDGEGGEEQPLQDGLDSNIIQEAQPAKQARELKTVVAAASDGEAAERMTARLRLIRETTDAILTADSPRPLLVQILEMICQQFPSARGAMMWRLGESESFRRVHKVARSGGDVTVSRTVVKHVLERKTAVLSEDTGTDERLKTSSSIGAQSMRSVLCVPIVRHDRVSGVLHLDDAGFRTFEEADLETVAAIAGTLAAGLDALDRRAQKTATAVADLRRGFGEAIRKAAVATTPDKGVHAGGIHIAVGCIGEHQLSGAFAEAVALVAPPGAPPNSNPLVIALGEVAGDTAATAVGAAMARATVRALAPYGLAPGALVTEVGRALGVLGVGGAGTAVVACFDPAVGQLSLAAAAGQPVIHHAATLGQVNFTEIMAKAPALGTPSPQLTGAPTALAIGKGDTVVLFTDGLVKKLGTGLQTVRDLVASTVAEGPVAVVNALLERARGQEGDALLPGAVAALRRT